MNAEQATLTRKQKWKNRAIAWMIILPLIVAAWYTIHITYWDLTDFSLSRRQTIAYLASQTTKEKLDRTVDVGQSFATRVQFRNFVAQGQWDEAMAIIQSGVESFSYIDRISLFTKEGILKASTNPVTPELRALFDTSFAYREYYQGVSKEWKPYVGEVIVPAAPLGSNLAPIAVPIRAETGGDVLGFLLLTIKIDTFLEWNRNVDVGPSGFLYIVDQKGHVVVEPGVSGSGDLVDFSSVPAVQKVLNGKKGIDVLYNPVENERRVSAYEPVQSYGWGVVAVQPTRTAFAERNKAVGLIFLVWVLVITVIGIFLARVLKARSTIQTQLDKERILIQSIGDGLVAIDRNWNITLWNHAAAQISGWSAEEAMGKPLQQVMKLIRERDRKEGMVFIEEAMISGKVRMMENHTLLITKDNREISVEDSAAPILDASGQVKGLIIIFRDVTEQRKATTLTSDFSYASHQLRTPVNKALWSLEVILGEQDPKKVADKVATAYQSIQSVHKLTRSLVEISELDQGVLIPKRQEVALPSLLSDVVKQTAKLAGTNSVTVHMPKRFAVEHINTDPKLLHEILVQVIDNAIRYSSNAREVNIEIAEQKDGIQIEVHDTGIGIPEDQQALIFTKFFRGSNFDSTMIAGTGLGLYIARQYTQLLGGKIWFRSVPDEGTTFSIFIPHA